MRRARTRYVPGGTPAIRYRPSEPVTAPSDPPARVTVAPVRGAPVCRVVTPPAIRPISWARSAQTGDNASAAKTARRFMETPPTVERSVAAAPRALRALHGLHAAPEGPRPSPRPASDLRVSGRSTRSRRSRGSPRTASSPSEAWRRKLSAAIGRRKRKQNGGKKKEWRRNRQERHGVGAVAPPPQAATLTDRGLQDRQRSRPRYAAGRGRNDRRPDRERRGQAVHIHAGEERLRRD